MAMAPRAAARAAPPPTTAVEGAPETEATLADAEATLADPEATAAPRAPEAAADEAADDAETAADEERGAAEEAAELVDELEEVPVEVVPLPLTRVPVPVGQRQSEDITGQMCNEQERMTVRDAPQGMGVPVPDDSGWSASEGVVVEPSAPAICRSGRETRTQDE